jgi:hypothetical protein
VKLALVNLEGRNDDNLSFTPRCINDLVDIQPITGPSASSLVMY